LLAFLPVLACAVSGCSDYHWTSDYQSAETAAQRENRYLFIYYKWWLGNDSARMETEVLADASVASHLRDTVNVRIEKDSSVDYARYMSKFGVTAAPAFVVVAPDGTYQVRTGFVPKDRFIEFIESAKTPRPARPGSPAAAPPRPLVP
jgi:hypothetical protein